MARIPKRQYASSSSATACRERGTTCASFIFIRSAGMRHSLETRSTSVHLAPLSSPERTKTSGRSFRRTGRRKPPDTRLWPGEGYPRLGINNSSVVTLHPWRKRTSKVTTGWLPPQLCACFHYSFRSPCSPRRNTAPSASLSSSFRGRGRP